MDETVSLRYIKSLPIYATEKPYYIFTPVKSGNIDFEHGPKQLITDIRGREREFTLKEHGFAFKQWSPPEGVDWKSKQDIEAKYIPQVQNFVGELLGEETSKVLLSEFRLRDATIKSGETVKYFDGNGIVVLRPADVVHIDLSPLGVVEWLQADLGIQEANEIMQKYRIRILNVWRPLVPVVADFPLAICDARTATQGDFIEVMNFLQPGHTRRNMFLKHSEHFKFHYLSRMSDHEVCVFVVFDSKNEYCPPPHTAFPHTKFVDDMEHVYQPRESIEVRIVVITDS